METVAGVRAGGVPAPRIWVTSVRRGAELRVFTPGSPEGPPPAFSIYIGRGGHGYPPSPLANPYRLECEEERERVIARYAAWLDDCMCREGSMQRAEILRILALSVQPRGVALGCWCAPLVCHGDEIRRVVIECWRAGWHRVEGA